MATEVIVIFNKNGDILDFSPRNIDLNKLLEIKDKEVYDDGELIRVKGKIDNK
ncbi:hypothetical protein [Sulfolobus sp. S-194]|uniref:hypothetical protein n=1 Tax=Sulfolobus sp. S-194 TaxID=2512240 RepID=UPI00143AE2CB|nr:hypothetical protein [Sulfolobus sp. S-194]